MFKDNNLVSEMDLPELLKGLEKQFGKGSIMMLNDRPGNEIMVTSSGSLLLDQALGIQGYPEGRIVEIFGPESAGKTTIALMGLAEAQKTGGRVAFIDAEHALDAHYCLKLGLSLENLLISQPDSGEQALEILEVLVKSGLFKMIVIDSVAALVPQAELDGDITDQMMGLQARLMSKALRRLAPTIAKSKSSVIFINQIREKIGVIFGNNEITPGGRALKFYSSIRIDVRKGEQLSQNQQISGHKIRIKVVKNKLSWPYKTALLDFYFASGVSKTNEIIDLAVAKNLITKSGTWFSYEKENIGQGKDKVREHLENNPEILTILINKLTNIKDK